MILYLYGGPLLLNMLIGKLWIFRSNRSWKKDSSTPGTLNSSASACLELGSVGLAGLPSGKHTESY